VAPVRSATENPISVAHVDAVLGPDANSRERNDPEVEILVETNWRSLESIRNFAGPDLEAAVVPDQAAALLTSFDRRVQHSEIAVTDWR